MYDARSVANAILDAAARYGFDVSNLKLQKLLYFAHGKFLLEHGAPLVRGGFEAWQLGPVHPSVYKAFKHHEGQPITDRAMSLDPVTRQLSQLAPVVDRLAVRIIDHVVLEFGGVSPGRLVAITHAKNGPWDRTVQEAGNRANLGLKISDEVIRSYFGKQIVLMRDDQADGDIDENTPYS